jgi:uncharacterized protein (DUF1015 family)
MASSKRFIPFRGLRYNPARQNDISAVLSPPYDIINRFEQAALYEASPYNAIRLELNRAIGDERYHEARYTFDRWQKEEVLIREEQPVFYLYRQTFEVEGLGTLTRSGFIGLMKVEHFSKGRILPHERTLSGPKTDRSKLIETTKANFSPIFSLYNDPERKFLDLDTGELNCVVDVQSKYGREELYAIADPQLVEGIADLIEPLRVYIADGHHRYETALHYSEKVRESNNPEEPLASDYVLMFLSNMADEGLAVLPVHRLIHSLKDLDIATLAGELEQYFTITPFEDSFNRQQEFEQKLGELSETDAAIGIVSGAGGFSVICHQPQWKKIDELIGKDQPEPLRRVDVNVLHAVICEKLLGIDKQKQADGTHVKFCQGLKNTFDLLAEEGRYQLAAFVNTPRLELIRAVAESGATMPQKSTYFYPKLMTGLVFNRVDSF